MPVRIPLVPAAPADGKQYVQKDGAWVTPPAATTTDAGLLSKEDKALLDDVRAGNVGGSATDLWISDLADSNVLTDKDSKAVTDIGGQPLIFGDGNRLNKPIGIDITAGIGAKTFTSYMWNGVSKVTTIDPKQLPFVFNSEADAKIAAAWMLRELATVIKGLENDYTFDVFFSSLVSMSIESKIKNGPPVGSFVAMDMDNRIFTYDGTTDVNTAKVSDALTEWFEVIVGSNADGTKYYSFWVLPYFVANSTGGVAGVNLHANRFLYQTVANDTFELKPKIRYYYNGTYPALGSDTRDAVQYPQSGTPMLTTRDANTTVGTTLSPAVIWLEPITFQMNR